ncbi:hypothetical protein Nepgr_023267 [Nepenthes gracilis]|uniref:Uncharacterized protein n=1 Tax=Nepenthes gracilis TaxID=150966 RepID=A0AAD3T0X5_NEPGR|nr:hypothetical protein Nepgr_023267 [Nepenthes gracilis]
MTSTRDRSSTKRRKTRRKSASYWNRMAMLRSVAKRLLMTTKGLHQKAENLGTRNVRKNESHALSDAASDIVVTPSPPCFPYLRGIRGARAHGGGAPESSFHMPTENLEFQHPILGITLILSKPPLFYVGFSSPFRRAERLLQANYEPVAADYFFSSFRLP